MHKQRAVALVADALHADVSLAYRYAKKNEAAARLLLEAATEGNLDLIADNGEAAAVVEAVDRATLEEFDDQSRRQR